MLQAVNGLTLLTSHQSTCADFLLKKMAAEEAVEAACLLCDALSAVEVIVRKQQQTENLAFDSPQEAAPSGAELPVFQRRTSSSRAGGTGRPNIKRSMDDFVIRAQENFK